MTFGCHLVPFLGPKYTNWPLSSLTENPTSIATREDRTSYTELYPNTSCLLSEGKYDFPLDIHNPHCVRSRTVLVLPRGWYKWYAPMQFFFYRISLLASYETLVYLRLHLLLRIGSVCRYVDRNGLSNSSFPTMYQVMSNLPQTLLKILWPRNTEKLATLTTATSLEIYDSTIGNNRPFFIPHEELLFPGVTIKDVKVSELVTFFDLVDFDVTNLLNDEMTFVDGKFVWDKTLLARQMRLNHKPFEFDFTIESDKSHKVVIRTFLGPKYDEFGRVISLTENRENFMEIDSFIYTLKSGVNEFKRLSKDFYWTVEDRTSYTELYKYVMLAFEGKYDFPLDISEPHCGFPDRLVLPRGWYKGMPMQFFFYVTPYSASYEHLSTFDYTYSCGIGSGVRYVDEMPFGYPFDREIDEYEFFVPNMYFKDMKIAIALLAIVGLVAGSAISKQDVKIADKDFLAKQKFLFEIVYRVEDPLMFEEYIKLGKTFTFNKADYTVSSKDNIDIWQNICNKYHFDMYMEKFYEAYKHDALLPKGEFFGALVKTHLKQAYGLFEFFYYAKNWEVFQRNVAFARMHCNEGMFVYALTLAVIHRDDFHGLICLPSYEIFPQYFFNSKIRFTKAVGKRKIPLYNVFLGDSK
ncbi:Arylphorin subunit A4 [Lucilia cuprina]|nr:Arylphorin subunit A4 [Lucilia cuprina]